MNEKLFQEFPPISTNAWEDLIQKDLKGGDYDKKLVWKTREGFPVRPYYRKEDLDNIDYLKTNPGEFPYVRGVKADNNWAVRQDIIVNNVAKANALAQQLVTKGVDSLGFILKSNINESEFSQVLKGINLEETSINIIPNEITDKYVKMLLDFAVKNNFDLSKIQGSNEFDSLGYMLLNGNSYCGKDDCKCGDSLIADYAKKMPKFKLVTINGCHFTNAGGSAVHELGFALAMGAEYIRKFSKEGISIDKIASSLQFNFAAGSNYFMEIAKLRAAKLLWAKIIEANSPKNEDSAKIYINTETSMWNKTVYDPYVNMLRSTTEAMSAVLGGTNSLNVHPFDTSFAEPTEFSMRIARNVQVILKEEAHLNKVVDPGAGSYYIENLTDSIIENAWALFLKVEDKGGFVEALKQGFIQNEIEKAAEIRKKNVATRRESILGTNQFPNFNEPLANMELTNVYTPNTEAKLFNPIKLFRASEEFEKLRLKTDKAAKRPLAFMLTIGNLNFRKARAQFSCNFFACAGFEVTDNNGFETIDEGLKAARSQNAEIVVLCSSDDDYVNYAPELFEKKDKEIVVIAGNPACKSELEAKGINNFVHVRSNVLEELKNYQTLLGIK